MSDETQEELRSIALNLKIQADKLLKKIDSTDRAVDECYREIDAMKYDIEVFEQRLETNKFWRGE